MLIISLGAKLKVGKCKDIRDWFVEKDTDGVSILYSLADFIDEDGSRICMASSIVNEILKSIDSKNQ